MPTWCARSVQGEELTRVSNEKLKRDVAHTLSSFDRLDFSGKDDAKYLYSGEDMGDIAAIDANLSVGNFIDFGPRERKQRITYNEAAAYAAQFQAAGIAMGGRKAGSGLMRVKAPVMNDYQFFQKKRIEELVAKENTFVASRRDLQNRLKVGSPSRVKLFVHVPVRIRVYDPRTPTIALW